MGTRTVHLFILKGVFSTGVDPLFCFQFSKLLMKGTLPGEQSTFSTLSQIPFKGLSWNSIPITPYTLLTDTGGLVGIGP